MIAIVDHGMGNLHSVRQAFATVGAEAVVTSEPDEIRRATRIVLPGVGAFGECVKNLRAAGVAEVLEEQVMKKGKPFLGICLGLQVLASTGDEGGRHEGLGWVPGAVKRLEADQKHALVVPHVGWNHIRPTNAASPLFHGLGEDATFYFVHSYYFAPDDRSHAAATCRYGDDFTCAVVKDNIFATQFHPEKSQHNGLTLLENFLAWRP